MPTTVTEPAPAVNGRPHLDTDRIADLWHQVQAAEQAFLDAKEAARQARDDWRAAQRRLAAYLDQGDTEPLLEGVAPLPNGEDHAEDERPRETRPGGRGREGGAAPQPGGVGDGRPAEPPQPDGSAEHDGGGAAAADRPGAGGEGGAAAPDRVTRDTPLFDLIPTDKGRTANLLSAAGLKTVGDLLDAPCAVGRGHPDALRYVAVLHTALPSWCNEAVGAIHLAIQGAGLHSTPMPLAAPEPAPEPPAPKKRARKGKGRSGVICDCDPKGTAEPCQHGEGCLCPCHPARSATLADLSATAPTRTGGRVGAVAEATHHPAHEPTNEQLSRQLSSLHDLPTRLWQQLHRMGYHTVGDVYRLPQDYAAAAEMLGGAERLTPPDAHQVLSVVGCYLDRCYLNGHPERESVPAVLSEAIARQGLALLHGIPTKVAQRLAKAGYVCVADIAGKRPEDLAGVKAADAMQVTAEVERWLRDRLAQPAPDATLDLLTADSPVCCVCTAHGEPADPACVSEALGDLDGTDVDMLLPASEVDGPLGAALRTQHEPDGSAMVCVSCLVRIRDTLPGRKRPKAGKGAV